MKLTDKQEKFCQEYFANGFDKNKAYEVAYEQGNKNVCYTESAKMLGDQKILDRILEVEGEYRLVGHSLGIDKKMIMNRLKDQLYAKKPIFFNGKEVGEADDNASVNKAIEIYLKLVGDFQPEKKSVSIVDKPFDEDLSKMSEKEREDLRKEILRSL